MKKTLNSFIAILLVITNVVFAQVKDDINSAPFVPIDVVVRGRQAVADYLTIGIEYCTIALAGRSVVAQDQRYLDANTLRELGYTHRGSFKELSDATANVPFYPDVIQTPEGWYDVRVVVTYYLQDGRVALQGGGSLSIWEQPDGSLMADKFNPYVTINGLVAVRLKGSCVGAVMWIPNNYVDPVRLPIYGDEQGLYTVVENRMLGNGYLAIADCYSEVVAWDLKTSTFIEGKRAFALLGKVQCGDVVTLNSPINPSEKPVIDLGGQVWFHRLSDGTVVGRMPLIEQPFSSPVDGLFTLGVPVWNSQKAVVPDQVYVIPIAIYDDMKGLELYQEYQVPLDDQHRVRLKLPAGIYHIRTVIPGLRDWNEVPGKG